MTRTRPPSNWGAEVADLLGTRELLKQDRAQIAERTGRVIQSNVTTDAAADSLGRAVSGGQAASATPAHNAQAHAAAPTPPAPAAAAQAVPPPKPEDIKGQADFNKWLDGMSGKVRLRKARNELQLSTTTKLAAGFFGPDDVGKTMAARVYAGRLRELGVIADATVHTIDLRQLLDDGEDLAALLVSMKSGVIYVDNLQALNPARNKAEIKMLADLAGRDSEPLIVVGGSAAARALVDSNYRLKAAFANQVGFKALAPADLRDICIAEAERRGYALDDEAKNAIFGRLRSVGRTGAATAIALVDKAYDRQSARLFPKGKERETPPTELEIKTLTAADLQGESPLDANGDLKSLVRFMKERVGQDGAKAWANSIAQMVIKNIRRQGEGKKVEPLLLNGTVEGEPGTGKTTLIEFVNEILTQLGIRNGKIVYKTAAEIKGASRGEAEQIVRQLFEDGEGGIIVIDEAHQLCDDPDFGHKALKAMVPLALNYSETTSVFFLGYDLKRIYDVDPGWNRRIPEHNRVVCESFTREQLRDLVRNYCSSAEYELFVRTLDEHGEKLATPINEALDAALFQLDRQAAGKDFGNAGSVNNLCQRAIVHSAVRSSSDDVLMPEDFGAAQLGSKEIIATLDQQVGLGAAREQMERLGEQIDENRKNKVALRTNVQPYAMVASDDVALRRDLTAAMASMYYDFGLTAKAKPVYVDALKLKAQFTGQTRDVVRVQVSDCLGGMMVLGNLRAFVDADDDFRTDAVGGLKEELRENPGKLTFVLSGTDDEIRDFLALDRELSDIITERVDLPTLDSAGATEVFRRLLDKEGYKLDDDAQLKVAAMIDKAATAPDWKGVASVQELVRRTKTEHSTVRRSAEFADRDAKLVAARSIINAVENYAMARFIAVAPKNDLGGATILPGAGLLPGRANGEPAQN